jgi:hypothetical protein
MRAERHQPPVVTGLDEVETRDLAVYDRAVGMG